MQPLPEDFNLFSIVNAFRIKGAVGEFQPIDKGHINDTFLVKNHEKTLPDYVLQRINHKIFKDVPLLMNNIYRVTKHINKKRCLSKNSATNLAAPELILTRKNDLFYRDISGNFWRCYTFCPHAIISENKIGNKEAYEGGRAIGKFQVLLADLPGGELHETIPGFHHLKNRMDYLRDAIDNDCVGREQEVEELVTKLFVREQEMMQADNLCKEGKLPVRVTHNDTKFNNILFDENHCATAIIDLDTVMNGSILYDFGDAVRTLCNTAVEDEESTEKINFNTDLFFNFSRGYLSITKKMLLDIELDWLAFSCKLMTYIMAVRFLTDYINGDAYFKTTYPRHNLVRAINQIRLLGCMEKDFGKMERMIREIADA
jgi:thiamine kinase-like enzyme